MATDTDVLIVGAGIAGLGFAVQLVRRYGHRNFEIVDKAHDFGGTWLVNSYPGCGVDVASHYYSYSFEPNPNWSQKFSMQPEIHAYLKDIADKYGIEKHAKFRHKVRAAHWQSESATWLVTIEDLQTSQLFQRRCKVLISAIGVLSIPKKCDIPGKPEFDGRVFHTAEWDHSFDWKDKEIIVVGNGCSASQVIPVIIEGDQAAKKVTQFARQAQWIFPRPNPKHSSQFKFMMRWVPFAMRLHRLSHNYTAEMDFYSFDTEKGADIRKFMGDFARNYMLTTAPEKYHKFLVPKTEPGCVRRVMDTDYLQCLNRDNVELIHDDPTEALTKTGIRTRSGRIVKADAVIMANGFEVQKPLVALNVYGEGGVSIAGHWNKFSDGAASAYFGTCLSEFPNFFVLMGPNTASGHGNVLYVTECQINWTLRAMKPILRSLWAQRSLLPTVGFKANVVKVKASAEQADIDQVQEKLKGLVWSSGCTSWALDPVSNRNTIMYPDFQYKFWLRSLWVPWSHFEVIKEGRSAPESINNDEVLFGRSWNTLLGVLGAAVALKALMDHKIAA